MRTCLFWDDLTEEAQLRIARRARCSTQDIVDYNQFDDNAVAVVVIKTEPPTEEEQRNVEY